MRTLRGVLLSAAALAVLLPAAAEAQQGRRFENAWFWGIKGGGTLYEHSSVGQDAGGAYGAAVADWNLAPTVGLEWLITRTRGGLYASYEQGLLEERTGYTLDAFDPNASIAAVDLNNLRRVNLAGMLFPPVNRWMQPYVGLGVSLVQIADAETVNPEVFADAAEQEAFEDFITEQRTQLQPLAILGVQARLQPFSVFIQGTATRFDERFLIRGGSSAMVTYEIGIRYNIGSAIERL